MGRSGQRNTSAAPRRADMTVGRTYLLVHPERFPSNDWDAVGVVFDDAGWDEPPRRRICLDDPAMLNGFEERYGAAIADAAGSCDRRICLLDETAFEDYDGEFAFEEDLTVGLPADGWELAVCEPHQVGHVVRRLLKGASGEVLVAGYARHDCVARALAAAKRLGLDASLHEAGTLPLNDTAAAHFFA